MHYSLLILALVSLSTSPVLVKLANAPIEMICFWRLLIAGFILQLASLAFPAMTGGQRLSEPTANNNSSNSGGGAASKKAAFRWALITGFFFFVHLWTFVFAVQHTTVAHTVILFSTNPIFTYIISQSFLSDAHMNSTTRLKLWISYPLSLLGILILVSEQDFLSSSNLKGDVVIVLSAFLHSIYLLASRRARAGLGNLEASKWINWVAGSLFLITALFTGVPLLSDSLQTWLAIGCLIAMPSLMGHTLFTYLVNHFPVNILSLSKLIEPIMSMGLAAYLLGEGVTFRIIVSFLVTAFGLSVLYWPEKLWRRIPFVGR